MEKSAVSLEKKPNLFFVYFHALAVRRTGLARGGSLPALRVDLAGYRMDRKGLRNFYKTTGLHPGEEIPPSYPFSMIFPLHMKILEHRDFPLLYVRMLQIRNHIIQHRPLETDSTYDISCSISGQRIVPSGLEMDVHSIIMGRGLPVWESVNVYLFRGTFGEPGPQPESSRFPAIEGETNEARFLIPDRGGFQFGLQSGDFNAIHYVRSYARRMGFRGSFANSQLSLTQCLRRLPREACTPPFRLDVAFKGPVYYNTELVLRHSIHGGNVRFDLLCGDDPRPCVSGRIEPADRCVQTVWPGNFPSSYGEESGTCAAGTGS